MLESTRASMAAAMVGTGTARSSATRAVHRPVPFWPASSRTMSTSGSPVERIAGVSLIVGAGALLYFTVAWFIGGVDRDDIKALFRRSPALSEEKG